LYVRHLNSSVARPLKELKDFARIHLAPQEEKTVHLSLPAARLAYWDAQNDRWVVEKGQVEITVGGSSVDARLTKTIRVR
jgi:beta-glucosidase